MTHIPAVLLALTLFAVSCSLFSAGVLLCEIRLIVKKGRGYYDE